MELKKTYARFRQDKRTVAGVILLILLSLSGIFAGFIAPYSPTIQKRELFLAPPTKLHFLDGNGNLHAFPFVYGYKMLDPEKPLYGEDVTKPCPIHLFFRGEQYLLFGLIPCEIRLLGAEEPGRLFLFGSDGLGRDVFSRLVYGSRISLSIAAVALLISFPLGLLIGSLSGFYGGAIDFVLMRVVEVFLALPALYLVIALRSSLPLSLPPDKVFLCMVAVIALFGWAELARISRGMVLSLRERGFVTAAVVLGASDTRIILRHLVPHLYSFTLIQAALSVPGYMLAEVTLSYFGLGIQEPLPSWGNMLALATQDLQLSTNFWWNLAPGVAVFLAVMAFNFLGEGLRDLLDPKMRTHKSQFSF